ncbi:serine O-acetyltransferase [Shumkonia mesophila]|uniref:serine O-acetyltransferase n=1 Tax=Shumkonia mesophila TaxID=2838854 RepID=UPI002934D0D6|nr:serine O-acetyltransferase [Shumkonia mesophila]
MFFKRLRSDIDAIMERDPAARSRAEVVLCYPGFQALLIYRLAHGLWCRDWLLAGRFVSHIGRILTNIEIHPGAFIGNRLVIDHGSGVVIGETSVIGDDVTLYQGVTLGGTSPAVDSRSQANQKRHPTLEDGVIIGSGAQVLGPIVIGEGARVGANAVVTRDIPRGVTAAGIPARVIMPRDKQKAKAKEFVAYGTPVDELFDPVLRNIDTMRGQMGRLAEKIEELEERLSAYEGAGAAVKGSDDDDEESKVVARGGSRDVA